MRDLDTASWKDARFLSLVGRANGARGLDKIPLDLHLRDAAGTITPLSEEIAGADVVVMIASAGSVIEDVSIIGETCATLGIMTTGIIVESGARADEVERTLRALTPARTSAGPTRCLISSGRTRARGLNFSRNWPTRA